MSDTQSDDLGGRPEPEIEPAEPNPGGVDALPETDEVVPADLAPEKNPSVDTTSTPTLTEGEDTSTKATEGEESDATEESSA